MCAKDSNSARTLTTPRADFSLTFPPKGEKQNSSGPVRAISSAAQRASTAFPLESPAAAYGARGWDGASQENAKGPCKVSSTSSRQQGAVTMMRTCMNNCTAQKAKVHLYRWHS